MYTYILCNYVNKLRETVKIFKLFVNNASSTRCNRLYSLLFSIIK